ncbi:hypothetical protein P4H94_22970 [Paenibacillus macerans]|uniref:hypothetical protein n=1 Tax=Paenibacillus macerans TaxID=44252 RepID=UPI002DBD5540|nr:hypothetical protein [Paenibacillus macerans]MEC0139718.1 hypothetical protein [Paenibacillus macerans]
MRTTAKAKLAEEIVKIAKAHGELDTRLFALYEQGKITSGAAFLVYNKSKNAGLYLGEYSFLDILPWTEGYKRATTIQLEVHCETAQKYYLEALRFVEEQEAADLNNCQKALVAAKAMTV